MTGSVPRTETYETWLRRQQPEFQDDVLGLTRGKLFREGGLLVDRFVDATIGRAFTLDELRWRKAEAWAKVGL